MSEDIIPDERRLIRPIRRASQLATPFTPRLITKTSYIIYVHICMNKVIRNLYPISCFALEQHIWQGILQIYLFRLLNPSVRPLSAHCSSEYLFTCCLCLPSVSPFLCSVSPRWSLWQSVSLESGRVQYVFQSEATFTLAFFNETNRLLAF